MDEVKLIETVGEIINNELIYKEGLILTYQLNNDEHLKLDKHFYDKMVGQKEPFSNGDDFEVEINGIIIKIVKNEKG